MIDLQEEFDLDEFRERWRPLLEMPLPAKRPATIGGWWVKGLQGKHPFRGILVMVSDSLAGVIVTEHARELDPDPCEVRLLPMNRIWVDLQAGSLRSAARIRALEGELAELHIQLADLEQRTSRRMRRRHLVT